MSQGTYLDIECAGVALRQDELLAKVREGMTAIIEGAQRARRRSISLARQGSPLSVVATRAERRTKQKQAAIPRRPTPLLTPLALRVEKALSRKLRLTELDEMLTDDEAAALELWAACEQLLGGRAQTVGWSSGGGSNADFSPIPDAWLARVSRHVVLRQQIGAASPHELIVLASFAAIQNGHENAMSPASYAARVFPKARNKRQKFLDVLVMAARRLTCQGNVAT